MNPAASIVITTRNRREELATALESCFAQDCAPLEVLVFDDASTDGTSDFVKKRFPEARVFRTEAREGLIVLRNRGFRESRGDIVFSIDDDAYYTDRGTVGEAVRMFKDNDRIGAIALPFIEPRKPMPAGARNLPAPGSDLRSYRGCAHAVRREAALKAGGYREFFVHQGEERDLCIRLRQEGYRIVYGSGAPVVHMVSPTRDQGRMDFFGVRNTLLFDMLNIPHPYFLARWGLDAIRLFVYKLSVRSLPARFGYVLQGFRDCLGYARFRHPVSTDVYRRYRSLPGHGPMAAPPVLPHPASRAPQPRSV